MADIHDRWVAERRNERYYRLAKKLNYRSRASFKLIQLDEKFGIFQEGDSVVDLGASPGGWLQVAQERTWPGGRVVGVDLRPIRPLEGVETILGDITEDSTMAELLDRFGGKADVVISDMAPNIGGHYSTDHARSVELCMYAVDVCDRILKKEGRLVVKVFMGDMFESLRSELEKRFQSVKVTSPDASRPTSSEVYVVCKGFHANSPVPVERPVVEKRKPEFEPKGGYIRSVPELPYRDHADAVVAGVGCRGGAAQDAQERWSWQIIPLCVSVEFQQALGSHVGPSGEHFDSERAVPAVSQLDDCVDIAPLCVMVMGDFSAVRFRVYPQVADAQGFEHGFERPNVVHQIVRGQTHGGHGQRRVGEESFRSLACRGRGAGVETERRLVLDDERALQCIHVIRDGLCGDAAGVPPVVHRVLGYT